ncbi:MAG: hypothetical protein B7Y95_03710 [Rhizobiales bacterium 32-66-11]|nr:MAG: hypothetical protein B7Y95_03710 [Rhizobiales bacterium 32-66-11]
MEINQRVHDLHTWIAQITDEMASEYDRIYATSSEDPGTAGDQGEKNWATVLEDWLPSYYQVETKGRLIGPRGELSPQMDVVVLKPGYPRKLMRKKIWLAHGVAAVFECKNTLKAEHIGDVVRRSQKIKALYERSQRVGTPTKELRSPLIYGLLAHSHSWKSSGSKPLENIEKALLSDRMTPSHPRFEVDLICVADLAYWRRSWLTMSILAPEIEKDFYLAFSDRPGPSTYMNQGAMDYKRQESHFRPIGGFIASLVRELARDDVGLRDIADYYRECGLWGVGEGQGRIWPISVYSQEVKSKIFDPQYFFNGIPWNEWDIGGF